jgi:hypothetical protein
MQIDSTSSRPEAIRRSPLLEPFGMPLSLLGK